MANIRRSPRGVEGSFCGLGEGGPPGGGGVFGGDGGKRTWARVVLGLVGERGKGAGASEDKDGEGVSVEGGWERGVEMEGRIPGDKRGPRGQAQRNGGRGGGRS